jgi:hypothetical protein
MGNSVCNCNRGNDVDKNELLPEETIITIEDLVPTDENSDMVDGCKKYKIKQNNEFRASIRLPAKYKAAQYVLDNAQSE